MNLALASWEPTGSLGQACHVGPPEPADTRVKWIPGFLGYLVEPGAMVSTWGCLELANEEGSFLGTC